MLQDASLTTSAGHVSTSPEQESGNSGPSISPPGVAGTCGRAAARRFEPDADVDQTFAAIDICDFATVRR
jgi:hypothetical protein